MWYQLCSTIQLYAQPSRFCCQQFKTCFQFGEQGPTWGILQHPKILDGQSKLLWLEGDSEIAVDNDQVVKKNWKVRMEQKSRVSTITSVCQEDKQLQKRTELSPRLTFILTLRYFSLI